MKIIFSLLGFYAGWKINNASYVKNLIKGVIDLVYYKTCSNLTSI
jgi:hypothetical protein